MLFDEPVERKSIIKVIGIGGGGTNAVNHMFELGIEGVEFAVSNTDVQSMEESPVGIKIQLGPILTEGRGAGSRPGIGKEACIESIDHIRAFLDDGTKMLFITAGMGGGTGTGAAPIVAKASKDLGILTVAIVTLPFKFEGQRRQRQALEGLDELKKNVDSILVISNDRLRVMFGNLALSDAFNQANKILTTAAKGIAEIITLPGNVNVDFEDVNTVIKDSGVAIMGSAQVSGENRAKKAIDIALNSPLLEDNDIRGAKHILLNISSGTKEVTMDEIGEITEYIQEEAGRGTDLIWGNCMDEGLGENLSITLIATGFEEGKKQTGRSQGTQIVSLEESVQIEEMEGFEIGIDSKDSTVTIEFGEDDVKKTINTSKYNEKDAPFIKETDERRKRKRLKELEGARSYSNKTSGTSIKANIDNPANIKDLEKEPAYKRREIILDEVKPSDDEENVNYRVTIDSEEVLESNNSYLHDNVD